MPPSWLKHSNTWGNKRKCWTHLPSSLIWLTPEPQRLDVEMFFLRCGISAGFAEDFLPLTTPNPQTIKTPQKTKINIKLSASPSSVFHTKCTYQNWNSIKHSIWTIIKVGLPVQESSTKISKFHAPNDSENKFSKAIIENWLSIGVELGSPWLGTCRCNHKLGTHCVGVTPDGNP